MKSLIKLLFLLIIGILIYNYFLGTREEKASSEKIFKEFSDLGKAVGDLISQEKEKFDQGKYDDALDKINGFINQLKDKTSAASSEIKQQIRSLEKQKEKLKDQISNLPPESDSTTNEDLLKQNDELQREIEKLMKDAEKILQDL